MSVVEMGFWWMPVVAGMCLSNITTLKTCSSNLDSDEKFVWVPESAAPRVQHQGLH